MPSTVVFKHSVKRSLRFTALLLLFYITVSVVVYVTPMPLLGKLTALLLTSLSLFYYLARDVLLLFPGSWREISLDPDGVSVTARDGSGLFGKLENQTFVSPYFVALCVRLEGHRLPVSRVIFPDAMSADAFREFCVHLKFA